MTSLLPFSPHRLAATADPATSHEAARACQTLRANHHAAIRQILGASTLTADEIAERSRAMSKVQVCRRLGELVAAGLIRPTGQRRPTPSGRSAQVYVAVGEGSCAT